MKKMLSGRLVTVAVFAVSAGVGFWMGRGGVRISFGLGNGEVGDGVEVETRLISARGGDGAVAGSLTNESVRRVAALMDANAGRVDSGRMRHLLRSLPLEDFLDVGAYLTMISRQMAFGGQAVADLLEVWGERDAESAVAWYESGMPGELGFNDRSRLFLGWGRSDGVAALAYIDEKAVPPWSEYFWSAAMSGLAESAPDKALDFLAQSETFDSKAMMSLLRFHPEKGAEVWRRFDETDHDEAARDMVLSMTNSLAELQSLKEFAGETEAIQTREYEIRVAGMNAADFRRMIDASGESDDFENLANAMRRMNPSAFLEAAFVEGASVYPSLHEALGSVLFDKYGDKPAEYVAIVTDILSQDGAPEHASAYLEVLMRGEDWTEHIPKVLGSLKPEAQRDAAEDLFYRAYRGIKGRLEDLSKLPSIEARLGAAQGVMLAWLPHEAGSAMQWAHDQFNATGEAGYMRAGVSVWAWSDAEAASDWVAALPKEHAEREGSIEGLVDGLVRFDDGNFSDSVENFAAAARWATELHDPSVAAGVRLKLNEYLDAVPAKLKQGVLTPGQAADLYELKRSIAP